MMIANEIKFVHAVPRWVPAQGPVLPLCFPSWWHRCPICLFVKKLDELYSFSHCCATEFLAGSARRPNFTVLAGDFLARSALEWRVTSIIHSRSSKYMIIIRHDKGHELLSREFQSPRVQRVHPHEQYTVLIDRTKAHRRYSKPGLIIVAADHVNLNSLAKARHQNFTCRVLWFWSPNASGVDHLRSFET